MISDIKKAPIFKGREEDNIYEFLENFETIASYNGWTGERKQQNLAIALEGRARTWFRTLLNWIKTDYDLTVRALREKYCSKTRVWIKKQALIQRKMRKDENIEEYSNDILRRMQKLDLSEEESISIFIVGLRDDLQKYVILRHPTSFEMASNLAYEKFIVKKSFLIVKATKNIEV